MERMTIPISAIEDHPRHNARTIEPKATFRSGLKDSMSILGLLQPIVVFESTEGYRLVAGRNRLRAAIELGWTDIAAVTIPAETAEGPTGLMAASAAENMVRAPMHPVDQWRAMSRLTAAGFTLDNAAMALGLPISLARRLALLGHMHDGLIEAIAKEETIPDATVLRYIATAPAERQAALLREHTDPDGEVQWRSMAQACRVQKIPVTRAIFDVAASGIAVEEDLFAEPDDPERFTTTEVQRFLALQRAALKTEADASKGRIIICPAPKEYVLLSPPPGYRQDYTVRDGQIPKRWKKDDPRKVLATVQEHGFRTGEVSRLVAFPPDPASSSAERGARSTDDAAEELGPSITKAAVNHIAKIKGEAFRERVRSYCAAADGFDIARALLVMLQFDNVRRGWSFPNFGHRLVSPGGTPSMISTNDLRDLAGEILANATLFPDSDSWKTSGIAADWLARCIDTEPPRIDTAEVLKGYPGSILVSLAEQAGIDSSGTVKELRTRLVGKLPELRAGFQTSGPIEPTPDDDDPDNSEPGDE